MQTVAPIAQTLLRFCGLMQIVLGLLLLAGRARGMIAVQMLLGFVMVLALWALALLAAREGVGLALVTVALAWGFLLAGLGLALARLLTGHGPWLTQAAYLLAGLGAIGCGEALVSRIEKETARRQGGKAASRLVGKTASRQVGKILRTAFATRTVMTSCVHAALTLRWGTNP